MTHPLFEVRGLSRAFGERRVLDSVDFVVHRGECLVILGRSGSGKSVTLKHLIGLLAPDAGRIVFDGEDVSDFEEADFYPLRRRVAMLFQSGALFDSMTVFDNVAFPLREHTDLGAAEIAAKVREKLGLVRLDGVEERLPADLSGGMRKRAALARALALDPEVLLYDEPTTGLDPITASVIGELMRDMQRRLGTTSVVVTHDLPVARRVGDRVAFLDRGRFRFQGTWEEADASGDPMLEGFLAGDPEVDDEEP